MWERRFGYPSRELDQITSLIPSIQGVPMTLQGAYEGVPAFRKMVESHSKWKRLFAQARRLEGLPRHTSVHAAGIVLSRKKILDVCPLFEIEGGLHAVQYTMENLEPLGLIKMDVLALRNLTTIDRILRAIEKAGKGWLEISSFRKTTRKRTSCWPRPIRWVCSSSRGTESRRC